MNKGSKRGAAVFFLDEADKKFRPDFNSHGKDFNASIQSSLLTLIKGAVKYVPDKDSTVDTNDTMFVIMGAFQDLRDQKKQNCETLAEHSIDCEDSDLTDTVVIESRSRAKALGSKPDRQLTVES